MTIDVILMTNPVQPAMLKNNVFINDTENKMTDPEDIPNSKVDANIGTSTKSIFKNGMKGTAIGLANIESKSEIAASKAFADIRLVFKFESTLCIIYLAFAF
ncbi:MAG: hypothetical protein FWC41_05480 [Firmicutes bacterium]|nr:hypothetical protein [Bacillota bacterium]